MHLCCSVGLEVKNLGVICIEHVLPRLMTTAVLTTTLAVPSAVARIDFGNIRLLGLDYP